jgi:hypothetical protein
MSAPPMPPLDAFAPHDAALGSEEEFWENSGWLVRACAEDGAEILLWHAHYIICGRTQAGRLAPGHRCFAQVLFTLDDRPPARRALHDSPFLVRGSRWTEHRPRAMLDVGQHEGAVRWSFGATVTDASPPRFRICHAEDALDYDIALEAIGPAHLVSGFRFIEGLEFTARAEGRLRWRGREYRIRGFAQHEKFHLREPDMLHAARGVGPWIGGRWWQWHCGFSDVACAFLQVEPVDGSGYARLVVDGMPILFPAAGVAVEDHDPWPDPRSGVTIPARQVLRLTGPEGEARIEVRLFGRLYHLWDYAPAGVNLLHWCQGEAELLLRPTGGAVRRVPGLAWLSHTKRLFLETGENL